MDAVKNRRGRKNRVYGSDPTTPTGCERLPRINREYGGYNHGSRHHPDVETSVEAGYALGWVLADRQKNRLL